MALTIECQGGGELGSKEGGKKGIVQIEGFVEMRVEGFADDSRPGRRLVGKMGTGDEFDDDERVAQAVRVEWDDLLRADH
jgi:hypothetical protein